MTSILKFSIIAAIFAVSLAAWRRPLNPRDAKLLSAALAFTVVADFFMLIALNYEVGLLAFICVQILYNKRYGGLKPWHSAALAALFYALAYFVFGATVLVSLALAYTVLFGFSLTAAIRCTVSGVYPGPNKYLVLAGMLGYAICDVFVALLNSGTLYATQHEHMIVLIIWLFYIPGKFMLAVSGFKYSEKFLQTS